MDYEPVPIISKEYPTLVIPLLDSALYSIDIVVFDWRFYKNAPDRSITLFNNAVARAVARGVRVRCLVQNESVVRSLKQIGCDARMIQSKRILHTKLLIVDKNKVVLGSHNYTQSAFESNYEASIFVVLASKQNALVQYFDNLFGL
jgi:phosphatidylserine/phosphatidylglycerophosphate/cardiolipin synthase-like enzyme